MFTIFIFLLVALIGGSNAALVKSALSEFPPSLLVFLRFTLAFLIMLPFIMKSRIRIKPGSLRDILFAGLAVSGNVLFFALGVGYTSIIMSQLIYLPSALIVALIGYFFLKEKLSKNQIIGLFITMIGMGVLVRGSLATHDVFSFGTPIGNATVGLALLSWSYYLIISRKLSKTYSPFVITFFNFVIISLVSLPFAIFELNSAQFAIFQVSVWGVINVIGLAILSSVLFYFLTQWVVRHTSAFIASLTIYVNLLFSAIFGIVFFSEKLNPTFILGGVLILCGVFVATTYATINSWKKRVSRKKFGIKKR